MNFTDPTNPNHNDFRKAYYNTATIVENIVSNTSESAKMQVC